MEKELYWLWLSTIDGLGPRRIKKLLDYFDNAQGIWKASKEELSNVRGIGNYLVNNIFSAKAKFDFENEYKKLNKLGIRVVSLNNKCYPKLLKEIYDPPPILYYQGNLSGFKLPCISIVGSRRCTSYGKKIAFNLAKRLAELKIPVISGMARGIDTAVHEGALQTGITYAILGSGLDVVYPPENKRLMNQISESGAVLSSFPLGTKPFGRNFPVRNRIISGLSLGTIVVEATEKSGSLITANLALQQGREVFAIPGDITRKQSVGTNSLINVGAKLVQNIDDILVELSLEKLKEIKEEQEIEQQEQKLEKYEKIIDSFSNQELKVYSLLSNQPQQFEKIFNKTKLDSAELDSILLKLEIEGIVEQLPGRRFVKI